MKLSKVFSLIIAFVMLLSILPTAVFAETGIGLDAFVSHYPTRDEPFVELHEEYADGATCQWSKSGMDIEGETGFALESELDFCTNYTCTVVLSDDSAFDLTFDTFPVIESNVTQYNQSFEVSDTDKLEGYQWYAHITNDIAVTDENAQNECSSCESAVHSSYDQESNLWTGAFMSSDGMGLYELFCFEVPLKAGDRLLIDVGPEVEEIVITDSQFNYLGEPPFYLTGDIGVFDAEYDETYKITIFTTNRNSKISAYIRTYEEDVLLEGETENTPKALQLGNYYYCVATYENGYTLKSHAFLAMPQVVEQPNPLTREFVVTYPEQAKYQWYRIDEFTTKAVTLEGENGSALINYEMGATYYCEASYPSCMVFKSSTFTIPDKGDINGNGSVDSVDYLLLKRALLGSYELSEEEAKTADVNSDGSTDSVDYLFIKRIILGTYTA